MAKFTSTMGFRLKVLDRGEAHAIGRYSGGEQDLANLCMRLAIADWVSRERGAEAASLVLDEVFGSQDVERRDRVLIQLREIAIRYRQVFVITHVPEIAEVCDHQILIEQAEEGLSTA